MGAVVPSQSGLVAAGASFVARSIGFLVVSLVVLLMSTVAASADLIAFRKTTSTENNIWVADAVTGGSQAKVPGTESASFFALSPDGTKVAYELVHKEGAIEYVELYVVNPNGSEKRLVADLPYRSPLSWSPDGGSMAYEGGEIEKIYVLNVATGKSRLLGGSARQIDPCWSRDGNYIAFNAEYPEKGPVTEVHLDVMNADGTGSPRAILANEHPEGETSFRNYFRCSFGPRDELGFMASPKVSETQQIFTVNFDGSQLTQLTHDTESPSLGPAIEEAVWNSQSKVGV